MIFLISLALAALFIRFCAKSLKKHSVPYYIAATAIAAAVLLCTVYGVRFPGWFSTWVWPIFARSAFSTALFVAVMYAGAVPNGSKLMKFLMPIRGELSIIASILTLGHNISYGMTYFRLLFTRPDRLPVNQLLAAVCSLVMLCIMIPLFITSFKCVRRKMKGSSWKKLQRLAYGFYALIYIHVLLLTVPGAQKGSGSYLLTVLVYSVVFLTYGAMRIQKALRNQPARVQRTPATAAVFALLLVSCATAGPFLQVSSVNVTTENPPAEQNIENSDTPETENTPESEALPETNLPESQENTQSNEPETSETELSTEEAPSAEQPAAGEDHTVVSAANASTPASTQQTASSASSAEQSAEPSAAAQQPAEPSKTEQPAPAPEPEVTYQYQNGTFSGSGEGFEGTITVSVSIENDKITGISVVSSSDDEPYWSEGKAVISRILSAQSANVDTVSGATFSSGGIIEAVRAALNSAKN